MRQQTSLEFLMIVGAISLLMLSAITQYGGAVTQNRNIANSLQVNYSIPEGPIYFQKPYFQAAIPAVSSPAYPNQLELSAYGCANGTISIYLNSTTISFSTYNLTQDFYNALVYSDSFVPSIGLDSADIHYRIRCGMQIYNGSEVVSTSYYQIGAQLTYSAFLSKRNESVNYSLPLQNIPSISESSHCTYENFFYTPYSISSQCGSADAWQYLVPSSICSSNGGSFTQTICVVPQDSEYNFSAINSNDGYSYAVNLTLSGEYSANSKLSSSSVTSQIFLAGKTIGIASVENVSMMQNNPSTALVYGPKIGYLNSTYVSEYEQARQNLFSLLSYYNSSVVSVDVASQMQQAISEYDHYQTQLISASNNVTQIRCKITDRFLVCPAQNPFYYVINATVFPGYGFQNQTIQYQGSVIKVAI